MALLSLGGFVPEKPDSLHLGSAAPTFALLDIHGKQYRLQDFKGKILILNFWAFWCDTWKAEMPHLKELAARQKELGFSLVAVSVDGTRLPEFMKRTKGDVPFPVLLDVGGKVSAEYKITHVPTVVIMDAEGRVRFVKAGYPGNHVILSTLRKIAGDRARQAAPSRSAKRSQRLTLLPT